MTKVAELFDHSFDSNDYTSAVNDAERKLKNPEQTPSAEMEDILLNKGGLNNFALEQAKKHNESLIQNSYRVTDEGEIQALVNKSIKDQLDIENDNIEDFDTFLKNYFS